jgi:c-di-GMP-binding flagellar brake protein YcgR
MAYSDRRKHVRVRIQCLISYIGPNEPDRSTSESMGVVLDISRGGILIETRFPIEADSISLMILDSNNRLVEIKGTVLHSHKTDSGKYKSGICFLGSEKEKDQFAVKLVKAYNHRRTVEASSKLESCDWPVNLTRPARNPSK